MAELKVIMKVGDVARYLGLHPFTVQKYARDGKIPGFKIGSEWRFEKKHIKKWIKERSYIRTVAKDDLL